MLSRTALHTFPTNEALDGHTHTNSHKHTHTHTMKRQTDDESPLATGLGNLPSRQQIDRVTAHRHNCNRED